MSQLSIIEQRPGYFLIEGPLTFASIDKKTVKSFNFLNSAEQICIDLGHVETTDSAGLALMIEWIKQSRQYNTRLSFKNIPPQLLTLAKLSGFDNNEYFVG
ncbi:STAS domain-containing protein [Methylomarinum vadi]|uniref:STAS domain-containing protein n=1 Tax=Methylomarinum vadi TaxID=438855 RepID=UPI0004DEDFE2|nr:STAS domain-containing protein [Methylomarinum vadi]